MKAKGECQQPPKGRKYTSIEIPDEEFIERENDRLGREAAALMDIAGELDEKKEADKARLEEIGTQIRGMLLKQKELAVKGVRSLYFVKSLRPRAMAIYSWVHDRQEELRKLLIKEERTQPTFQEWLDFKIIPGAALVGLLWHPVDYELETPKPKPDDDGVYDFQSYGQAVLEELEDAEEGGLDNREVSNLAATLYSRAAGSFIGLNHAQERADFLQVRVAPSSEQPSDSE